ncbi:hypothetical protein [Mesorhizobium kowhaii]|uniref:Uncharacterized protein n=1 Tax=Mesorhizobium kowhaii TaxID=1300272 RepID=A0A2W7CT11_9HYPH|nr:hypothetical protein [Mesorhizobium kowhaii]PZV36889.1 hypothetical protein B5V02_19500 [Mesorhizobium kowhaii]
MAKNSSGKVSGTSRIRFVMVEAEIADGDIGQITQAIQNALRGPASPVMKRLAATPPPQEAEVEIEPEIDDVEESEIIDVRPAKPRTTRKVPKTPDVVDIDMNRHMSLASFAQGKDAKSQHKKYLIAAAWLKEHRGIDGVAAGHIYTCFRSMAWPINIPDFWQPLRELKSRKYFSRNESSEYEINHLGLDYVNKLGSTNGAG